VQPTEAKYEEVRTVPLVPDMSNFYVTLARMSVTGSTANFPVLIPPLAGFTTMASSPQIFTDLAVGVVLTVTDASASTYQVAGYSNMNTAPLVIPSTYPDYPRSTKDSAFYWVEYASTVADALNTAIATAFGKLFTFNQIPGAAAVPPNDSAPFLVPGDGSSPNGVANFEFLRAVVDPDTYKLTLSAPYKVTSEPLQGTPLADGTQYAFPNPFLGPTMANNPASFLYNTNFRLQAHIFFNDKLLDLFPMPTVPPASSLFLMQSFPGPVNSNASVMPGCSITQFSTSGGGTGQCVWLNPGQIQPVSYLGNVPDKNMLMYCIPTYARNAVAQTGELRATFGDTKVKTTQRQGPWMWSVDSLSWTQEYETTGSWAPITGIAITSNTISVFEEAYGINSIDPVTGAIDPSVGKGSTNILFDVDLLQDRAHSIQGGIYYVPGTYRWAKCKPNALTSVDLRLLLRKRDGTFVPWILDSGGTVNIKLMFCQDPY